MLPSRDPHQNKKPTKTESEGLAKNSQRGQWGEGSIGATIKDTRTKSRGRVGVGEGGGTGWSGVEGWGENADNRN